MTRDEEKDEEEDAEELVGLRGGLETSMVAWVMLCSAAQGVFFGGEH